MRKLVFLSAVMVVVCALVPVGPISEADGQIPMPNPTPPPAEFLWIDSAWIERSTTNPYTFYLKCEAGAWGVQGGTYFFTAVAKTVGDATVGETPITRTLFSYEVPVGEERRESVYFPNNYDGSIVYSGVFEESALIRPGDPFGVRVAAYDGVWVTMDLWCRTEQNGNVNFQIVGTDTVWVSLPDPVPPPQAP